MPTYFNSVKDAVACAARMAQRLDYPATRQPVGPGHETEDVVNVRICMRALDVDPDGREAYDLYRWATTSDTATSFDIAREMDLLPHNTDEHRRMNKRLGQAMDLENTIARLDEELIRTGMVRRPKIKAIRIGWRAVELDGVRSILLALDPDPDDDTIYKTREHAQAVLQGDVEGAISLGTRLEPKRAKHPGLAARLAPRWAASHYPKLGDLDRHIARELEVTVGHARRVRLSWGITGRPSLHEDS